ncbi:MAG TPA: Flp family type IVb pilin [Xanthobacteraceae bacterium]|nr:Flp family type IVb pilin [Xanthobacteraceae bacterium]
MRAPVWRFLQNDAGATAIEYSLIASGIALAIIATVGSLGSSLNQLYGNVSTSLK